MATKTDYYELKIKHLEEENIKLREIMLGYKAISSEKSEHIAKMDTYVVALKELIECQEQLNKNQKEQLDNFYKLDIVQEAIMDTFTDSKNITQH